MGVPRKVVQIAAATAAEESTPMLRGASMPALFALADDGSVWLLGKGGWIGVAGLPAAPACEEGRGGGGETCRLHQGHLNNHWDGLRRWA